MLRTCILFIIIVRKCVYDGAYVCAIHMSEDNCGVDFPFFVSCGESNSVIRLLQQAALPAEPSCLAMFGNFSPEKNANKTYIEIASHPNKNDYHQRNKK